MSKAGRVRCGRCERVLYVPDARHGWDRDGQAARHRLETTPADQRAADEWEALIALRNGPGDRPHLARAGVRRWTASGVQLVLTCPGKGCAVRYAVLTSDLRDRCEAAAARGEDVLLTAADRDRSS